MTRKANDLFILNTTTDESPTTTIHRWSLCLDSTYQYNNSCLACSTQCKTCLNTADQCTSCVEGKVYKFGTCGTC